MNVQLLILAQVLISQFVTLSSASGSVLLVWNLIGILSSLSGPPLLMLSLPRINIKKKMEQTGAPRWLSWLSIRLLILAQVMISRLWDWALHWALC